MSVLPESHSLRQPSVKWSSRIVLAVSLVWLVAYFCVFYRFTLPNSNPATSRLDVWQELPEIYLNLIVPVRGDEPSGWEYFPERLDLLAVALVIHAGAWGLGHLLFRLIRFPIEKRTLERTVLAWGLGLSGLSLVTLGLGLAGMLSQPLFAGLVVLSPLGESLCRLHEGTWRGKAFFRVPVTSRHSWQTLFHGIALAVLFLFLLAMVLGAMLPPTDFDAKEYHLQGPKEFFQTGRITLLPHNVYTSFPFLTEMLHLLAMVLRNDWYRGALAGKAVLAGFAPLTALAVFAAGRRWFGSSVGWLAAMIYFTTPWTYRIAIIAYAEGGLTFYLSATLLALLLAFDSWSDRSAFQRLVFLTGLLAGSAMACKYTGLIQVVVPIGIVLGLRMFRRWSERPQARLALSDLCKTATIFVVGVAVTIGPWLIKNFVQTGNPVYPLAYSVFDGIDWDADLNARWRDAHSPDNYALSDLGAKFIDVTTKSDWLSPLLFGFLPISFVPLWRSRGCVDGQTANRRVFWLGAYVVYLFAAWWLLTHRIDRFWIPMIPVVSLLAGVGAGIQTTRLWRSVCAVLVVTATLFNLGFITTALCGYNAYLTKFDVAREASETTERGVQFLNHQHLPSDAKVLCVGAAQVFDARFPLIYNTVFDKAFLELWWKEDRSRGGQRPFGSLAPVHAALKAHGVTHVYVNWAEILRYRPTYGYTDFITPERIARLRDSGVLSEPLPLPWAFGDVSRLSADERHELETWGRALIRTIDGQPVFVTAQIFRVADREERP